MSANAVSSTDLYPTQLHCINVASLERTRLKMLTASKLDVTLIDTFYPGFEEVRGQGVQVFEPPALELVGTTVVNIDPGEKNKMFVG